MFYGEIVDFVRYADHVALTVQDAMFHLHVPLRVEERDAQTGVPVTIGLGDRLRWSTDSVWWTSKSLLAVAPGLVCPQGQEVRLPRVGYRG